MTADLTEQKLREQLAAAVDAESGAYLDIDATGVLDAGHRVQWRRRVATVGATAVAALVIGAGAWTAFSGSTGEEQTLPAATPSTSVPLPEPVAEVYLGVVPQTDRTQPLAAAVALDEASGRLHFSLRREDGMPLATRSVFVGVNEQPRWATLVPGVTVAVLPADTTGAAPVWTGAQIPHGSAATEMPDGRVLVAWWTDGSSQAPFATVYWTDGQSVRGGSASLLTVVEDDHVFFADRAGGLVGYFAPPDRSDGFSTGQARASIDVEPGTYAAVWTGNATGSGGIYAAYLPPTRDVELVTGDGAKVRDVTVHELPGGDAVLVLAHVDGDRESVTDVRYTDLDGGSITVPAPAS